MDALKAVFFSCRPFAFSRVIAYMLQSTEYAVRPYLGWAFRTSDFRKVMKRRSLAMTLPARLLRLFVAVGMVLEICVGVVIGLRSLWSGNYVATLLAVFSITFVPYVWMFLVIFPTFVARKLLIEPKERRLILRSKEIFARTNAVKIVVAGSYGKTSMKELLGTVLVEGKKVAITPANKNVATSHAIFANSLKGDEEVLIIELGEGKAGDVRRFCETIAPDIAVVTGLAPAHLDQYASLEECAKDILSVRDFVPKGNVYCNGDSDRLKPYINDSDNVYSRQGIAGFSVSDIRTEIAGTTFDVSLSGKATTLHSGLLGAHNVGPITAVVAIAHKLGLTSQQIIEGVAGTLPYEHRMQPRVLQGGAWIIDDTYNGNIEGIKAGLELLKDLPASRKWYVTPGLVDQGIETEPVHIELGELITKANPDILVLMKNSVTEFIQQGLEKTGYSGDVRIENNPLDFYTNIDQHLAGGDLVLMQNDWTDNYK